MEKRELHVVILYFLTHHGGPQVLREISSFKLPWVLLSGVEAMTDRHLSHFRGNSGQEGTEHVEMPLFSC